MLYREPRWKSYIVKTSQPILTPEQCNELISVGQKEPQIESSIGDKNKPNYKHRKSNISWIPFTQQFFYQTIEGWLEVTNNNFFGFDNPKITEACQYSEYSKDGFYDWHMDSNITMEDMPTVRKISLTLLLSDPKDFEGGELEMFSGSFDSKDNKIDLKQGHGVFFASFIPHRVAPVIKGNRKSLVMWFGGPSIR
jgi:PKHD-type hydroxylase|tara:strand:+ start:2405 stop:2989 length:585 start_codon:yes stop_codon:yes gene_type:complete